MRTIMAWVVAAWCGVAGAQAVDIEWVTVGDPGNASELSGGTSVGGSGPGRYCGRVRYAYAIGKYEVTAGQYAEFLNAVATTDTYGLYNQEMDVDSGLPDAEYGCNIKRTGMSGSYSYSVAPDWANRPVNFVSWGDAARFANWLHNGQPSGTQDATTTEAGAYALNGATSDAALNAVTREPDGRMFVPSEDEWYKAAYYDGDAEAYYNYPTGSDTPPTWEVPPGTNMTAGSANHWFPQLGPAIGAPYYRTEVGAYDAKPSVSPYGTFDQGGNVWEWNEAIMAGPARGLHGGAYSEAVGLMQAGYRDKAYPTVESGSIGFRVTLVDAVCGNLIIQPEIGETCDDGNIIDGDGCSSTCQEEYCGDGTVQEGLDELCDDGNTLAGDGCGADCLTEVCGNGALQPGLGELCDDGNTLAGDGCGADCLTEVCGNGVLQPELGEACDDGNLDDGDGCNSACQEEYCGDGLVQEGLGELCDDGNTIAGDGCNESCQTEACGNGVYQPELGEQCDDGNTVNEDGCTADCYIEYCGDGTVQIGLGEQCEDGNVVGGDGCDAECHTEVCGNGVTQPLLDEECDDGNTVDGDGCDALCVIEYCGDGILQAGIGEACDDGNHIGGDGCDANCYEEVCGNGITQPALGEVCDDGNILDGDGCSADCRVAGIPCDDDLDCVFANNNCCEWDMCGTITPGLCDPPIPNMYGDLCGADFPLPPNGAVGLTDIICSLNAFGVGNLMNCPNADIASVIPADCPRGNHVVGLTDILKVLDAFGAPSSPTATFFCDCPQNP